MENRYVVTVQAYIYANSDKEAIAKSDAFAAEINTKITEDHKAEAIEVLSAAFGSFEATKIYTKGGH